MSDFFNAIKNARVDETYLINKQNLGTYITQIYNRLISKNTQQQPYLSQNGRDGRTRTDDIMLPKHALYQAELRPVIRDIKIKKVSLAIKKFTDHNLLVGVYGNNTVI